jgi:5-methylcytosine-specific restriction endonuclease McrA
MKNTTNTTNTKSRKDGWQGMNWCRPSTRLAIYLRDGLACVYCGHAVEEGAQLSLDHVKPHSCGGSNSPANLVTCCSRCNSSRGDRPVATFAVAVSEYTQADADAIIRRVRNARRRQLPRAEARRLIALRGTVAAVVKKLR